MALALDARDLEQDLFVEHRRAAQDRPRHQNLVLACEVADQLFRRIGDQRHPLGEFGARDQLGMGNEVDQDLVKEIDMVGPQVRGVLKEQVGDPACGLGAEFGIAIPDDLIKPGDQGRGDCHPSYSTRTHSARPPLEPHARPLALTFGPGSEFPRQFKKAW